MTPPRQERASALRFIVFLGAVSLFADMTYEGARSLMGPFLQNLGANAAEVGLIAGFGELVATGLRFFSGRLVDRTRAYWSLTMLGYALTATAVPLMALAGTWWMAALLVVAERTGKGLRGPARDVLLSSATVRVGHGWGFGLHTAMDQAGAVLGPLLMVAAVAQSHEFGPAFLRLAYPGAAAVVALLVARAAFPVALDPPRRHVIQGELPRVFWLYVAAAGLLAFGFADFPLIAYHFERARLTAPATIPLVYAFAMGLNGITALAFGRLFDRFGVAVLSGGILVSLLALPLAFSRESATAIAGVMCWGVGMGLQDATLRPGIAQVVSMDQRGRAFGAFNAVYGILWFAGSTIMGLLYDRSIPALMAFGVSAQAAAALLFFRLRRPLAEVRME
jgi:Major Facilitator Superfamily